MPRPGMDGWLEPVLDAPAEAGLAKPRLDGAGSAAFPFAEQLFNRVPVALKAGEPYPCQALLVYDANPLYSMPGSGMVREALQQIPFIVSFASHMDETAMMADVILPNLAHLERWEDVPVTEGFHRPMLGLAQPVVHDAVGVGALFQDGIEHLLHQRQILLGLGVVLLVVVVEEAGGCDNGLV